MYEAFYGLARSGFRLTPEHRSRFSHPSYAAALAGLSAGLARGESILTLSAGPGAGKSTLVGELAARLAGQGVRVGRVASTQVDADNLLQLVGFAFGLEADRMSKARLLVELARGLGGGRTDGDGQSPALLIVDEAQNLSPEALEALRLLASPGEGGEPAVQVLLSGQERLWETLRRPECRSTGQLIATSCRLRPLTPGETRDYIAHGLRGMGWRGDPRIGGEALALVHARTGGVPRLVNLAMSHLLLHGSLERRHALEAPDVETAIGRLGQDNPDRFLAGPGSSLIPEALPEPLAPLDARAAEALAAADGGPLAVPLLEAPELVRFPGAEDSPADDAPPWGFVEDASEDGSQDRPEDPGQALPPADTGRRPWGLRQAVAALLGGLALVAGLVLPSPMGGDRPALFEPPPPVPVQAPSGISPRAGESADGISGVVPLSFGRGRGQLE